MPTRSARWPRSPHFGIHELTVLLDVLADRLLTIDGPLRCRRAGPDGASATMAVLRRNLVPDSVVEPWIARVAAAPTRRQPRRAATPTRPPTTPSSSCASLYLQLALGPEPPADRADLILVLVDALRATNPFYARPLTRLSHRRTTVE